MNSIINFPDFAPASLNDGVSIAVETAILHDKCEHLEKEVLDTVDMLTDYLKDCSEEERRYFLLGFMGQIFDFLPTKVFTKIGVENGGEIE